MKAITNCRVFKKVDVRPGEGVTFEDERNDVGVDDDRFHSRSDRS